jgi:hypothetical protein
MAGATSVSSKPARAITFGMIALFAILWLASCWHPLIPTPIHKPTPHVTIAVPSVTGTMVDRAVYENGRTALLRACEVPFLERALVDPPQHVDVTVMAVGGSTTTETTTCSRVKKALAHDLG